MRAFPAPGVSSDHARWSRESPRVATGQRALSRTRSAIRRPIIHGPRERTHSETHSPNHVSWSAETPARKLESEPSRFAIRMLGLRLGTWLYARPKNGHGARIRLEFRPP